MQYRVLGNTGIKVSALSLGCMMFGWRVDASEALKIVKTAADGGINFLDTSVSYGKGASEEVLGTTLQKLGLHKHFIIATKVGLYSEESPDSNAYGNLPRNIIRQCEQSLVRLKTDHIDLLQLHRPSTVIPIEETLGALDQLVRSGKVRAIGTSNFSAWQIVESLWVSDRKKMSTVSTEQLVFNLLNRQAEKEIFEVAKKFGIGLITYSPLAEGLLTGKYKSSEPFPSDSRFAQASKGNYQSKLTPEAMAKISQVMQLAKAHQMTPAGLSISWVVNHPEIATVLVGPSSHQQIQDALQEVKFELPASVSAGFNALSVDSRS